MKATIDLPEDLYRQIKAKSALAGKPVRSVAMALFQSWVEEREPSTSLQDHPVARGKTAAPPPLWFGKLRKYAARARGRHDLDSVRESVLRRRAHAGKA